MFASKQLIKHIKLKVDSSIQVTARATICHKSELPDKKVYHWPYEATPWNVLHAWRDPFTKRKFNENSKIIQVEGNVASGKGEFARRLADELGMKYLPPVDLESYYVNDLGYDYRALNPLLPERLRPCDWEMFHEFPARHSVINLQYYLFKMRVFQYLTACRHIFNTGQGVILTRSAFTEMVFVEAMHSMGWLPLGHTDSEGTRFYDWKYRYHHIRNLSLGTVLKPHLTIYLETPVKTCIERIRNSSNPMIRDSKALVPEFLEKIQEVYQETVLPKQANHGHVLEYHYPNYFNEAELDDVIDDIKELDFKYDPHDTRFEDWDDESFLWYATQRQYYTTAKCMDTFDWFAQPWYDIAGMGDSVTFADLSLREALYEAHVAPFGNVHSQKDPIKILFGKEKFEDQLLEELRSDYL